MMTGRVFNRQLLVPVTFRLPGQPSFALEFVVDTGFVGYLTLPLSAVTALGLMYEFDMLANLADDSIVKLPVYKAIIVWNGAERPVRILAMGKRPLLGTALLDGCEMLSQFRDGGQLTVDELPSIP